MAPAAADAALAEFSALRAEIVARQQAQTAAVGAALTVAGAIGAVAFAGDRDRLEILLVLPFILCGLGLIHQEHSHRTNVLGTYVRERLWPELAESAGYRLSWEQFLHDYQRHEERRATWALLGRAPYVLIFFAPGAASLLLTALAVDRPPTWFWFVWVAGVAVTLAYGYVADRAQRDLERSVSNQLPEGLVSQVERPQPPAERRP